MGIGYPREPRPLLLPFPLPLPLPLPRKPGGGPPARPIGWRPWPDRGCPGNGDHRWIGCRCPGRRHCRCRYRYRRCARACDRRRRGNHHGRCHRHGRAVPMVKSGACRASFCPSTRGSVARISGRCTGPSTTGAASASVESALVAHFLAWHRSLGDRIVIGFDRSLLLVDRSCWRRERA